MNKDFLYFKNMVRNYWCVNCDSNECNSCQVKEIIQMIERLDGYYGDAPTTPSEGCRVCKDKKGNSKSVEYFDAANNFRQAEYCPSCGRKI